MQEIFEKQERTTKFYGLVGSEATQEFDQKLERLKYDWKNENQESPTFHFLTGFNKKR